MKNKSTAFPRKNTLHNQRILTAFTAIALMTGSFSTNASAHIAIGGIPPGLSEEYFPGGPMGTVFSTTTRCLELPSPAIDADPKLSEMFAEGEAIFEADFVADPDAPFGGLGPVYNNVSCRNCHPNYGRARRVEKFNQQFGNGYLAFVHTPDSKIAPGYLFMLQTMAIPPYVPPAKGVDIKWNQYKDNYDNKYPDGTPYNQGSELEGSLIYPTAELIEPLLPLPKDYKVSIEGTIGIVGTGLLDEIPDEDIIAEYERQQKLPGPIKGAHGKWIKEPYDGKEHLGKFTTHTSRATLQNGPGHNGVWNVFNITREDKPQLFATKEWIDKQGELGLDTTMLTARQPVELETKDLNNLMIWSRGLGVPAARNLNDPTVQQGKKMFFEAKCNECHKPSWTTGKESAYIPKFANQKIWPYTDLLLHDMGEINRGFTKTWRTLPLWARGMMKNAADHTDMMHDLRARNHEEAILWHFGEGEEARESFRNMNKKNRQALIKFLEAI